jgi:dTMP kinase
MKSFQPKGMRSDILPKATAKSMVISFSGPDGSGKTTQIELLREELVRRGQRPVVHWMRLGYTPGMDMAKSLLRKALGKKLPSPGASPVRDELMGRGMIKRTWLAAAAADLLLTLIVRVRFETWRGRSVICDRYMWDSLIDRRLYHSRDPWVETFLKPLFDLLGKRPRPAILLTLSFREAHRRSVAKNEPFPDTPEKRAARHAEYEKLARDSRFAVIDASQPPEEIARKIAGLL